MKSIKGFIRVKGDRQVSPWSVEMVFKREGAIHIQTLSGSVYVVVKDDVDKLYELLEGTTAPLGYVMDVQRTSEKSSWLMS